MAPPNLEDVATWRSKTDEGKRLLAQGRCVSHSARLSALPLGHDVGESRLREAEQCLSEALQAALRGFARDMPHVGMSANNMAEMYRISGRLDQARWLYFQARFHASYSHPQLRLQAMECFLGAYGEEDPRSALAMHNYAVALTMIGEHKEAHEMAKRAYRAMKSVHGSERTETLQSHYLVARTEWHLKWKRRALATAQECQKTLLRRGGALDVNPVPFTECISV